MASSCAVSPTPRDKKATSLSSLSAFASSSSSFAPRSSPFLTLSLSSPQLNLFGRRSSPSPSSINQPNSPRPSMPVTKQADNAVSKNKRMCMYAPTTHPGSFRCSYHRRFAEQQKNRTASPSIQSSSTRLNLRRPAMKNSLVRVRGVEDELVKRTLTTLIRTSSHQLRRREPRPSRLSMMSNAEDQ